MTGNTPKSVVVEHDGYKFGFTRDVHGDGYWYCLSSKPSVYGSGLGYMVPRRYWSEILLSAVSQGIDPSLLIYTSPVKKSVSNTTASPSKVRSKKDDEISIKIF